MYTLHNCQKTVFPFFFFTALLIVSFSFPGETFGDLLQLRKGDGGGSPPIATVTVSGTVRDESGTPLDGAMVYANSPPTSCPSEAGGGGGKEQLSRRFFEFLFPEGNAWAARLIMVTTSSTGSYSMNTIEQGVSYSIWSTHANALPKCLGTYTFSGATTLDITLTPADIYILSGYLTREGAGVPVAGAKVVFELNVDGTCAPDGDVDLTCADQSETPQPTGSDGFYSATLKKLSNYRITVPATSTTQQKIIPSYVRTVPGNPPSYPIALPPAPPTIDFHKDSGVPPGIQRGTQSAIFTFGTTNLPARSSVCYQNFTTGILEESDEEPSTQTHEIHLTGLAGGTLYYYQIRAASGSDTLSCDAFGSTTSCLTGDSPGTPATRNCDTTVRPPESWNTFQTQTGPVIYDPGPPLVVKDGFADPEDIDADDLDGLINGQARFELGDVFLSADPTYTNWTWRREDTGEIVASGLSPYQVAPPSWPTASLLVGSYTLILKVWHSTTGYFDEAERTVTVLPGPNLPPAFVPPEDITVTVTAEDSFPPIPVHAEDLNVSDLVTLSSSPFPPWLVPFTPPTPARTVDYTINALSGRPNQGDVAGSPYSLTISATDNVVGNPPATKRIFIHVLPVIGFQPVLDLPLASDPTEFWVAVGEPLPTILFEAHDDDVSDQVTFSLLGAPLPEWFSCIFPHSPDNPASGMCGSSRGPLLTEIGSYTFTVHAEDIAGNDLVQGDQVITIHVTRFKDVTATNLPQADAGRTKGADVTDIDGDGDIDYLAVGYPQLASVNPFLGSRILVNNGSGVFTDQTTTLLPRPACPTPPCVTYSTNAVRFARQGSAGPFNILLLSNQYLGADNHAAPDGYERHEEAVEYRLRRSGTPFTRSDPFFPQQADYEYWGSPINVGFSSDIESARGSLTGYGVGLYSFWGSSYLTEPILYVDPCPPFPCISRTSQFAVMEPADVHLWNDSDPPLPTQPAPFKDNFGNPEETYPITGDFELADVDGDGNWDVFAAGVAYYHLGTGDIFAGFYPDPGDGMRRPGPLTTEEFEKGKPRLWLNNGELRRTTLFPNIPWLEPGAGANQWDDYKYLEQKASFGDLNGDGKVDFVIADMQHGVKIYRNWRTTSTYGSIDLREDVQTPPLLAGSAPYGDAKDVVIGNLDGDGHPDLIVIGHGSRRERIFRNTTTPWPPPACAPSCPNNPITFSDDTDEVHSIDYVVTDTFLPKVEDDSNGGLLFDMENDGDKDLFIYNSSIHEEVPVPRDFNGQNRLYENKTVSKVGTTPLIGSTAPFAVMATEGSVVSLPISLEPGVVTGTETVTVRLLSVTPMPIFWNNATEPDADWQPGEDRVLGLAPLPSSTTLHWTPDMSIAGPIGTDPLANPALPSIPNRSPRGPFTVTFRATHSATGNTTIISRHFFVQQANNPPDTGTTTNSIYFRQGGGLQIFTFYVVAEDYDDNFRYCAPRGDFINLWTDFGGSIYLIDCHRWERDGDLDPERPAKAKWTYQLHFDTGAGGEEIVTGGRIHIRVRDYEGARTEDAVLVREYRREGYPDDKRFQFGEGDICVPWFPGCPPP